MYTYMNINIKIIYQCQLSPKDVNVQIINQFIQIKNDL